MDKKVMEAELLDILERYGEQQERRLKEIERRLDRLEAEPTEQRGRYAKGLEELAKREAQG